MAVHKVCVGAVPLPLVVSYLMIYLTMTAGVRNLRTRIPHVIIFIQTQIQSRFDRFQFYSKISGVGNISINIQTGMKDLAQNFFIRIGTRGTLVNIRGSFHIMSWVIPCIAQWINELSTAWPLCLLSGQSLMNSTYQWSDWQQLYFVTSSAASNST